MTLSLSPNRSILRGFVAVFGFLLIAKAIGAVKEIVIAHHYGTGPVADAYALGFTLVNWPLTVFAMGAGLILIPILVELKATDPDKRARLFRAALAWVGVAGIALAVIFYLALATTGTLWGHSLSAPVALTVRQMALPLATIIPLGLLATLMATRLMSVQKFINTAFEAIPSLVLILAIVAVSFPNAGGYVLGWGTLLGFVLFVGALWGVQPAPRQDLVPQFAGSGVLNARLGQDLLIVLVAQVLFAFGGTVIDQLTASGLSPSSNAVIGYANRLIMLITGLGATTVGRATLPVFAAVRLDGSAGLKKLAVRWVLILFGGGIGAALLGYVFAPMLIGLLFHHGAFDASDLTRVTETFRAGLWQLPFYFAGLILAQLIASQRRYWGLLIANIGAVATKMVVLWALVPSLGLTGIMYATAAMYAASLFLLAAFGLRRGT